VYWYDCRSVTGIHTLCIIQHRLVSLTDGRFQRKSGIEIVLLVSQTVTLWLVYEHNENTDQLQFQFVCNCNNERVFPVERFITSVKNMLGAACIAVWF